MNRTYDLKVSLPSMIKAGQLSPPFEISLVNYNSKDDLDEWIKTIEVPEGVSLSYRKYTGRDSFHMAHARNLSVVNSTGDYIIIGSADMVLHDDFVQIVRQMIEEGGYTWMQEIEYKGFIVVKREEFMAAGGYDERYEFYGTEDRDIDLRLFRRATGKFGRIPNGHIDLIRTAKRDKRKYYRPGITAEEMAARASRVYEKNYIRYVLVANEGQPWGQW